MTLACALLASQATAADEPAAPIAPAAATVTLVAKGKTPWHLVNRSKESTPVTFAAKELRDYIEKISGVSIGRREPSGDGPEIVIGLRENLSANDTAMLPPAADGHDGYAITLRGETEGAPARIVIGADNERGAVYAAYDLLERLGWRWVHPDLDPRDSEVIPKSDIVSLPAESWSVASPMKIRTLNWFEWRQRGGEDPKTSPEALRAQVDWAMKSRYNTFASSSSELEPDHPFYIALKAADERGMMRQIGGHNFAVFFPNDPKTFAEHPEWFGMRNGERVGHSHYGNQFCWSNEGAQKHFVDNIDAFIQARPEIDVLPLYGLDDGRFCECPACSEASPTDNMINLINAVVERLEETAPHVTVETLGGYKNSSALPKTAKPHDRLRVEIAFWGRNPTTGYDVQRYLHGKLKSWARAYDGRLTIYQYYSDNFAGPWMSAPYTKQMLGDRKFLLGLGADGFMNLLYPDGFWWRESLNAYLAGRSFYDVSIDPNELLEDYARSYYGPDAGPLMAKYYAEWAANPVLASRSRSGTRPEHRKMIADQRRDLIDPALAASADQPVYRYRVEKAEKLHRMAEEVMELQLIAMEVTELRESSHRDAAINLLATSDKQREVVRELARSLEAENAGIMHFDDFVLRATVRLRDEAGKLKESPKAKPKPAPKPKKAAAPRSPAESRDAPPDASP